MHADYEDQQPEDGPTKEAHHAQRLRGGHDGSESDDMQVIEAGFVVVVLLIVGGMTCAINGSYPTANYLLTGSFVLCALLFTVSRGGGR